MTATAIINPPSLSLYRFLSHYHYPVGSPCITIMSFMWRQIIFFNELNIHQSIVSLRHALMQCAECGQIGWLCRVMSFCWKYVNYLQEISLIKPVKVIYREYRVCVVNDRWRIKVFFILLTNSDSYQHNSSLVNDIQLQPWSKLYTLEAITDQRKGTLNDKTSEA